MRAEIRGRVVKFGDHLNTDVIIPGRYLIYVDPEPLSEHAFEVLGDEYPDRLREFDILVAGENFGCGSAREQAVTAIQGLGIHCVVASSFARAFYRNAINRGFPIVECPELIPEVKEGDEVTIDLSSGQIRLGTRTFGFPGLPETVQRILDAGGLVAYLRDVAGR